MSYYYYYLDLPLSSLSLLSLLLFEWLLHLVCLLSSVPCAPQKSLSHTNSLVLSKLMISHKALIHCISPDQLLFRHSLVAYVAALVSFHVLAVMPYAMPANLSIYPSLPIHPNTTKKCIPALTDQPIHLYFFVMLITCKAGMCSNPGL